MARTVHTPLKTISDDLVANLVIEMCMFWLHLKEVSAKSLQLSSLPNDLVRAAHKEVPHIALEYVEWTHMCLYLQLGKWTTAQFHEARDFLTEVAKSSFDIQISS